MKTEVTLEDLTRANWVVVTVLSVLAAVLLILAQMLGEIAASTEMGRAASVSGTVERE